MRISIINGSPKLGESTSALLIAYLTGFLSGNYTVYKPNNSEPQISEIVGSDAVVFVFPLYVDGIPSHMLRFLGELEKRGFSESTVIYCVINNGFFEGGQNRIAIEQMRCWCYAASAKWGCAVGCGAGEMLPFIKNIPLEHGPNKNLGNALRKLSEQIVGLKSSDDILISPNWPRPLWRLQSSLFVWLPRAKRNGLKRWDLFKKSESTLKW